MALTPYYDEDGITIYHGDCRDILPHLPKVDLMLTDPPYGIDYVSHHANSLEYMRIVGDKADFDPAPFLSFDNAIMWGGNNYADKLPIGGWICWDKRLSEAADKILGSPFELAWCSHRKLFRIVRLLHGGAKNADAPNGDVANAPRYHPTQKPIKLMMACLSYFPKAQTILDPFMGSGTTLRAAKDLGRKAIGIEIEEKYCEIAVKRLAQGVLPL